MADVQLKTLAESNAPWVNSAKELVQHRGFAVKFSGTVVDNYFTGRTTMYVTGDPTYSKLGVLFDFETEPNPPIQIGPYVYVLAHVTGPTDVRALYAVNARSVRTVDEPGDVFDRLYWDAIRGLRGNGNIDPLPPTPPKAQSVPTGKPIVLMMAPCNARNPGDFNENPVLKVYSRAPAENEQESLRSETLSRMALPMGSIIGPLVDDIIHLYIGSSLEHLVGAFEAATERLEAAPDLTDLVVVISCHGQPDSGNFPDWHGGQMLMWTPEHFWNGFEWGPEQFPSPHDIPRPSAELFWLPRKFPGLKSYAAAAVVNHRKIRVVAAQCYGNSFAKALQKLITADGLSNVFVDGLADGIAYRTSEVEATLSPGMSMTNFSSHELLSGWFEKQYPTP